MPYAKLQTGMKPLVQDGWSDEDIREDLLGRIADSLVVALYMIVFSISWRIMWITATYYNFMERYHARTGRETDATTEVSTPMSTGYENQSQSSGWYQ